MDRPNQVWATDICYVPMVRGFVYVVAIMDGYSHKVPAWRIPYTRGADFCVEALQEAIHSLGAPEVFSTDQEPSSPARPSPVLSRRQVSASAWTGRGCWLDNVFVERLWRSLKHEGVYLGACETVAESRRGMANYFRFCMQTPGPESADAGSDPCRACNVAGRRVIRLRRGGTEYT